MQDRLRKTINAYVKNHAVASAVSSFLTNRDCSEEELLRTKGFDQSAITLLPILGRKGDSSSDGFFERHYLTMTAGKIVFVVCGVSASGKDTLASYAKHKLYLDGKEFTYTRKYTTRSRRGYEDQSPTEPSGNYRYLSSEKEMRNMSDAALEYTLYDNLYALSGDHLASGSVSDQYQMCIYGKLENVYEVRRDIFLKYERLPFTILVAAPEDDCEARILRRHSMSSDEQMNRIREMKRQSAFIARTKEFVECGFDIVIENGNGVGVDASVVQLAGFISERIHWADNAIQLPPTLAARGGMASA